MRPLWLLALAACACAAQPRNLTQPASVPALQLRRLDGTTASLEEFRGQVVLLDFWATWCEPCKQALPAYGRLFESLRGRGFTVLAVSVDESDDAVKEFLARVPVPFPVFRDPEGEGPRRLDATAMPMSFLFDRDGVLRWRHAGFVRGDEELVRGEVLRLLGDREQRQTSSVERPVMGTMFRVSVHGPDTAATQEAIEAAFRVFHDVDQLASEWKRTSPLSEVNRQAGQRPVALPESLFTLLSVARGVAERSQGAFDPTWAALWGLWRFDGTGTVPKPDEIRARLALIGWQDLALEDSAKTAFLRRPGMVLGLGGIAKGFALQLAADELRRRGFHDFLLYAGGQVLASGGKTTGPWKTGIQDPRGAPGDFFCTLDLKDVSVSTSGDYEHAFIEGGVRYHHLIDLRTGYPARGLRSATVVARDATLADAWSTAAFVLGAEKGLALAKREGFELLVVDDEGRVQMTDGLAKAISLRHPPAR